MNDLKINETINQTITDIMNDPEIKKLLEEAKKKAKTKNGCPPCQAEKMLQELPKIQKKYLKKYLNSEEYQQFANMLTTQLKQAKQNYNRKSKSTNKTQSTPLNNKPMDAESLQRNILDRTTQTLLAQMDKQLRIPPQEIIEKYQKKATNGDKKAQKIVERITQKKKIRDHINKYVNYQYRKLLKNNDKSVVYVISGCVGWITSLYLIFDQSDDIAKKCFVDSSSMHNNPLFIYQYCQRNYYFHVLPYVFGTLLSACLWCNNETQVPFCIIMATLQTLLAYVIYNIYLLSVISDHYD